MSLASKIFWSSLLVLAVVLGITGWISIRSERIALEEIQSKYGKSMAQSLAAFSVEALVSDDYPSLEKALRSIGENTENIIQIKVLRNDKMLASYGQGGGGQQFEADVMLTGAGLDARKIGSIRVTLSTKDSETLIASRIRELLFNSLIIFFTLGLVLNFLVRQWVLVRLSKLTERTEKIIDEEGADPFLSTSKEDGDELDRLSARYSALLRGLELRNRQRRETMNELQDAQALLDDVTNSLPSALIVLGADGRIEYENLAAEKLRSPTAHNEKKSDSLPSRFPALTEHSKRIARVGEQKKPVEWHRQFWPTEKGQRIVNVAAYPLSTRIAGGVVVRVDDVTDRTRFEEVMIQSEKLASIGGLAAGIAHEINNPLGVMMQAAQNIERRVSEEIPGNHKVAAELGTDMLTIRSYLRRRNVFEFLDDIKTDGVRAGKIVSNLLEFSRKSTPVFEPTCVRDLLERAVELACKDYNLRKKFDFRRIEVSYDVFRSLPEVPMVRSEIEQVVLNLLKNAAHAMEEKFSTAPDPKSPDGEKPFIRLAAKVVDNMMEIRIMDNGCGFSEEAERRVFEPFFTTKSTGSGTGLGLWVSYMIVTEKHHGQLLLESTSCLGSTFLIRLPL